MPIAVDGFVVGAFAVGEFAVRVRVRVDVFGVGAFDVGTFCLRLLCHFVCRLCCLFVFAVTLPFCLL